jgi:hypothetical protein
MTIEVVKMIDVVSYVILIALAFGLAAIINELRPGK